MAEWDDDIEYVEDDETTTWRKLIKLEMGEHGETFDDVVSAVGDLDVEFDPGHGGTEGPPFTVWTRNRVYFPACYDGLEWVASVSRNPDGKPTEHVGG